MVFPPSCLTSCVRGGGRGEGGRDLGLKEVEVGKAESNSTSILILPYRTHNSGSRLTKFCNISNSNHIFLSSAHLQRHMPDSRAASLSKKPPFALLESIT